MRLRLRILCKAANRFCYVRRFDSLSVIALKYVPIIGPADGITLTTAQLTTELCL